MGLPFKVMNYSGSLPFSRPEENDEVERFMEIINKFILTTGKPEPVNAVTQFFSASRGPYHTVQLGCIFSKPTQEGRFTIFCPSQNFSSRPFRITANDTISKGKMKTNSDQRRCIQTSLFLPGGILLLKNRATTRSSPCPSIWSHARSSKERRIWWLQVHDDRQITRNSSFFKRVQQEVTLKIQSNQLIGRHWKIIKMDSLMSSPSIQRRNRANTSLSTMMCKIFKEIRQLYIYLIKLPIYLWTLQYLSKIKSITYIIISLKFQRQT